MKLFQDIPNLAKLPFVWYTLLVKSFNEYYYFKITSRLWSHAPDKNNASDKNHFEDLPREKERCFIMLLVMLLIWSCFWFSHALFHLGMLLLTYSAPRTRILKSYNSFPTFWGKKWNLLFTVTIHCYYSLSLFICYYSLRIFAYLRGVVPYISSKFLVCLVQDFFPRESYHLWAFLWEISLLTTTSLHLYYLYKACNS